MTETKRTWIFVALAAVSMVVAWVARPPADITPDELIAANLGKEFFPDFKDPTKPTSIQVVSFDEGKAASRVFAVEFAEGLWRIPSHHNYPADGADRLARTSSSLIGLKREEYVPRGDLRHEEFGVVDPLDSDSTKLKGRGQRITLRTGDNVALDLIIGKEVKGRSGFRYLRHPDEKNVYVAKVSLDLSTKFADWVETDLLKLSRDEIIDVVLDNYTVNQAPNGLGEHVPGEVNHLSREKAFDPWKFDGLDPETEEVDATKANDIVNTLDDLKLTGVRPKPPGVNADLTIDRSVVKAQAQLNALVQDLVARGFVPAPGKAEDDPPRLYGKQGELLAKSNKGIVYTLRFGEVFTGDEQEVETGEATSKDAGDANQDNKPAIDEESQTRNDSSAGKQSSRYLLVSVAFDEEALGPKPVKPQPPPGVKVDEPEDEDQPPPEDKKGAKRSTKKAAKKAAKPAAPAEKPIEDCGPPAPADAPEEPASPANQADDQAEPRESSPPPQDAAGGQNDPPANSGKNNEEEPGEPAPPKPANGDDKAAGDAAAKPEEKPKEKSADDLKKEYEASKKKYEDDLKAWKEKYDAGQKKVKELNTRFGAWYYVISADSFNKLHLSRKELVKPKTKTDGEGTTGKSSNDDAEPPGDTPSHDEPTGEPDNATAPEDKSPIPDDDAKADGQPTQQSEQP